eukprot:jgi/Botrbrau1/17740/Bobra.0127s0005.1
MDLCGDLHALRLRVLSYLVGSFEFLDNAQIITRRRLGMDGKENEKGAVVPLTGKLCIVTGANAGIGEATTAELVARGARVIMACRSVERGNAAAQMLKDVKPREGCRKGSVEVMQLDLGSLKSVRKFSDAFNRTNRRLDVLACNAGIMAPIDRHETVDHLEEQFQVNYLGHWLLAHNLMAHQRDLFKEGQESVDEQDGGREGTRVVFFSSVTHLAGSLNFDDLQLKKGYTGFRGYANSKLATLLAAREFQRRFDRNTIAGGREDVAVAVHPGLIDTNLARGWMTQGDVAGRMLRPVVGALLTPLMPHILLPLEHAVDTVMFAITAPMSLVRGQYIANKRVANPSGSAQDLSTSARLWDVSCDLADVVTSPNLA